MYLWYVCKAIHHADQSEDKIRLLPNNLCRGVNGKGGATTDSNLRVVNNK